MFLKDKPYQQGFTWVELAVALFVIVAILIFIFGPTSGAFDSEQTSETKKVAADFEKAVNEVRLKWSSEGGQGQRVEFNGHFVEVTENGWPKQLDASVEGCKMVWDSVLTNAPDILIYSRENHAPSWSVGGGPDVCFFINQQGEAFDQEDTPYFRYAYKVGQIARFNM